ncbi:MAG: SIMPL domain-containing protein [Bacillaceae bacterium]|nr:SIMPL domain-containing protein [Bacillaceae bacterium]
MYTNPYQPYQHTSKNMSVGQPRNTFEDSYKNGKIVVHGEAFITSPPDTVTILLGAITESLSLGEAHQENSKRISAVLESIRNFGISEDDIQTVDYRMDPQYDFVDGKQKFRGYQVVHLLNITLRDVNMTGIITDASVAAGANTIRNIQFSINNSSALYQQALIQAVNNGKTKATSIATSLNINLDAAPVKVKEIIESDIIPFRTMSLTAAEATQIQPGTLQIKASVVMTFSYSI